MQKFPHYKSKKPVKIYFIKFFSILASEIFCHKTKNRVQYLKVTNSYFSFIFMARTKKESEVLKNLFGDCDDMKISKKLVQKLVQYNMKYEEITKVILTHSERAFLDARLTTLEEYYDELTRVKKSEVENFLASLPECKELSSAKKKVAKTRK